MHIVHDALPAGELYSVPISELHFRHVSVPLLSENFPLSQSVHEADELPLKVPGGQGVQEAALEFEKVPLSQL